MTASMRQTFEWQVGEQVYALSGSLDGPWTLALPADQVEDGAVTLSTPALAALGLAIGRAVGGSAERKEATRAGTPWTDADDQALRTQHREGASIRQIARQQRRTRGAIVARLILLGLEPKPAPREVRMRKPRSRAPSPLPTDDA